ncbi:unnamed protein product [Didymodactylos carnosus]|uniref:Uncharacterized protein n=1 Tax=Didymodactylos carnosus TaxID=1234261 RepID=A0A814LA59_9BILA|nr:unnamed protein product [Didymodactylos carnosus]CAF1393973.1 unnamed protein product [Didymodactylos carnosus]CAF3828966.1 unnamed protein product [Didymodactylos carnosus]CAF4201390.1 unnamed protein product [Didymodactylos carnosus]
MKGCHCFKPDSVLSLKQLRQLSNIKDDENFKALLETCKDESTGNINVSLLIKRIKDDKHVFKHYEAVTKKLASFENVALSPEIFMQTLTSGTSSNTPRGSRPSQ